MATITKKCWPTFFEQLSQGKKQYDVRLADFPCEPGDTLVFQEYDPKTKTYMGRTLQKKITVVVKTKDNESFWSKEDLEKYGLQFLGLE